MLVRYYLPDDEDQKSCQDICTDGIPPGVGSCVFLVDYRSLTPNFGERKKFVVKAVYPVISINKVSISKLQDEGHISWDAILDVVKRDYGAVVKIDLEHQAIEYSNTEYQVLLTTWVSS